LAQTNYKLNLLINSFTIKELEEFRLFISCPLFTNGRNYFPFLEYVLKTKNKSDKHSLPEKIKASGNENSISKQTLRNRCSELNKLCEDFLIYKGLSENKSERDKFLFEKMKEKKLYQPLINKLRKSIKQLNHEKFDVPKLKNLISLSEIYSGYLTETNKIETLYNEFYDYSKQVFCLNLLVYFQISFEFIQQELNDRKYESNYITACLRNLDIGETMSEFRKSDSIVFKVTSMNYYLFKAFGKDISGIFYSESHKIFTETMPCLKDSYKINIFRILINLCIKKLNEGELNYRYELFKLYNEKLSQKLTADLENNTYTFNHFRDYIFIGIAIKKYKWVENFIQNYSGKLPVGIRKDETMLSYAKLYFEKKNYKRSLENLNEVNASHYLQYIDSSLLKLCNYYELEKYEEAFLEIDKQIHFLKNHREIPRIQHFYCINFVKIYKKLIRIKTEPVFSDKGIINKELAGYKHIAKRNWLQKKIFELIK